MAFLTVRALYSSAHGIGLVELWLANSFNDGLFQYFSLDCGGLPILSHVNGFHDGLRAIFLSG